MQLNKIAEIISEIFGPHLWMPLLLVALTFNTGLNLEQIKIVFPSLFFSLILIPFVYLHLALKLGWVSHWDLPKKEERRAIFILLIVCSLVSFVVVNTYATLLFRDIFMMFLILGLISAVITFFWKISIHMLLDTMGTLILNYLFDWQLLFLFILIPLVAWARFKLKRHTISQIVAGFSLSLIVFFSTMKYFHYL